MTSFSSEVRYNRSRINPCGTSRTVLERGQNDKYHRSQLDRFELLAREDTTTATKPLCHCWVTTRYCCRKTASTTNGTNVTWIVVDPRVDPVRKKAIFIIGKSPEIIGRRPLLKLNLVTVTSSPRDGPAGVNRIMTKQSAPCVRDLNNKSIPSWADV